MFASYTVAPERSRNLHASARGAARPQTNRQEGLLISPGGERLGKNGAPAGKTLIWFAFALLLTAFGLLISLISLILF